MVVHKRCLLWDYTNTRDVPNSINQVNFKGPMKACSNWNAWVPPELKGRAIFRPMIRSEGQLQGDDWKNIQDPRWPIIHYFNEPERAGISPQHAAEIWHEQLVPLRKQHGKKLASPSCASDEAGHKWLTEFMQLVKSEPPDFVGVHYYGTEASAAREYLEGIHHAYPKHKIIVSEIAAISRDRDKVSDFTRNIANWMDETDWIFEYGFFGCMEHMPDNFVSPAARLMTEDGHLTKLMHELMNEEPIKK